LREWTEEQENAIRARNTNLLVAAAAGSGKTAVLVERIIQLIIEDKVDIDRMLVVTFTHAAAGEMRERISAALLVEMENRDKNEENLIRQMNLLNRASISTLHAFCTDVVRKYFHLIDVDPNFRIGDTTETSIMKLEAIEELLESEYAQEYAAFLNLVEMFGGGKDDTPLQNLVLQAYEFIQSKPNPLEWLKTRVGDFNVNEEEFALCPWVVSLTQQLRLNLSGARDLFSEALQITEMMSGPLAYQPALIEDVRMAEQLLKALDKGLPSLHDQLAVVQYPRLGRVSKDTDGALQEEVKELRTQGKKIIETIQSKILFQSPEQFRQDLNELYPEIEYLSKLVTSFTEVYRDKKSDKGILDFNDLEHYALAILAQQEVAEEYQRKYAYIFVDEYQDSNLVQEIIINCIKKENNLFLVGDVKQSIYRFRLADPSLFLEKHAEFASNIQALNRRIDLRKNFRSRKEIIEGINCIFRQIMSRDFGEIEYDKDAYLYPGVECHDTCGDNAPPSLELLLIEKKPEILHPDGEPVLEQEAEEPGAIEVEARVVAQRIQELCGQLFYDSQEALCRPLEYRDIVVLMRATRQRADVFSDTFRAVGIPVYADVEKGYFQTLEINIFMNLLKIIDNKRQDIPLLSVLRSPIGKFALDDLIAIRAGSQAVTYYEAMEEYLAKHSDELQIRLQTFLNRLNSWKEAARYTAMDELIWKLLLETGYYYYVGAMPGGMQRQANLRMLFNRASQFQTTSLKGLFHFIKFVDKIQAGSGDIGMAKVLGENDNVVRIMSIHKSKGLEFPVVILAGMGNGFNLSDTKASVLFHKDLGIGPYYVNPELRINKDTIARAAMKNKIKMENMAEEMRILYVACTRARDKLIMVGSLSDLPRRAKTWSKKISPFQLSQAKCHMDWVGPVALRHRDGFKVRELCAVNLEDGEFSPEEFRWRVEIISRSQAIQEEGEPQAMNQDYKKKLQEFQLGVPEGLSPEKELIEIRLNWQYLHGEAVQIPSKLSVSQIKNLRRLGQESLGIEIPQMEKRPRFLNVGGEGVEIPYFSGAEKGNIMHFVMQHLDFRRVRTIDVPGGFNISGERERTSGVPGGCNISGERERTSGVPGGCLETEIADQIQEMVKKELLGEEQARLVDVAGVLNFFRSDLGQRILQAEKVYREVPFNLVYRASDVIAGWEKCEEELLVQGVIDLYFWEGEEIVLLDYKTDRITPENREELIDKYRIQVDLYKTALESIQGHPVKDSYLYLFDCDEEVKL
jgi:ATP-dependent helicase/nuclease subunit A